MSNNSDMQDTPDEKSNQDPDAQVIIEASESDDVNVLKAEIDALKAELDAADKKAQENYNLALRTKAETENARRRMENDISKARNFAIEKFAQELLPVVDSLEMGLAAANSEEANIEKFREGSEMLIKMFLTALDKSGVQVVDPEGEKFNPDLHQAMTMQENAELAPNTVMNVIQKGYTLNNRLLRPAMVVVSKEASAPKTNGNVDEIV